MEREWRGVVPNLFIPAITAVTAAVSAAIATGAGFDTDPYDGDLIHLTRAEAATHAAKTFDRADQNSDGKLSADEFTALSIVTAELAHLNGFVVIEGEGNARVIALPLSAPVALSSGERARVEAVARNAFYASAGGDGLLTKDEFANRQAIAFSDADRNRNGALAKSELEKFAVKHANFSPGV